MSGLADKVVDRLSAISRRMSSVLANTPARRGPEPLEEFLIKCRCQRRSALKSRPGIRIHLSCCSVLRGVDWRMLQSPCRQNAGDHKLQWCIFHTLPNHFPQPSDFGVRRKCLRIDDVVYRRLADLVVVLHVLITWFVLFGAFLCWQHAGFALVHVPLAAWVTASSIMGWICPLTPLENHLRKAAGEQGYEGSFVDHYLGKFVAGIPAVNNPKSPTSGRKNQIILGVFFGVLFLVLHGANVARYHDAIWPPSPKPPVTSTAR